MGTNIRPKKGKLAKILMFLCLEWSQPLVDGTNVRRTKDMQCKALNKHFIVFEIYWIEENADRDLARVCHAFPKPGPKYVIVFAKAQNIGQIQLKQQHPPLSNF